MFGLGLLGTGVTFGVDDVVFNPGGFKGFFKETTIIGFPTGRRGTVREQNPNAPFDTFTRGDFATLIFGAILGKVTHADFFPGD